MAGIAKQRSSVKAIRFAVVGISIRQEARGRRIAAQRSASHDGDPGRTKTFEPVTEGTRGCGGGGSQRPLWASCGPWDR